jgi:hypothetical protein
MPQKATYLFLTDEQETCVTELKKERFSGIPSAVYILLSVASFAILFILLLSNQNTAYEIIVMLGVSTFMYLGIAALGLQKREQFLEKARVLTSGTDPIITGILTKAVVIAKEKDREAFVVPLIPLLYSINKYQATDAFTDEHRQILRNITSRHYWHKHEPDLVAAALVGLVALNDNKSNAVLEKLAKRRWKRSEAWIGEAAVICLKEWLTR